MLVDQLPSDVLQLVLAGVDALSLSRLRCTCRKLNGEASRDSLWQRHCTGQSWVPSHPQEGALQLFFRMAQTRCVVRRAWQHIRHSAPLDVVLTFSDGASLRALGRAEAQMGARLPDELRESVMVVDGQVSGAHVFSGHGVLAGARLLSVEEMEAERRFLKSDSFPLTHQFGFKQLFCSPDGKVVLASGFNAFEVGDSWSGFLADQLALVGVATR